MKIETAQQRVKNLAAKLEAAQRQKPFAEWHMEAHFEWLQRLQKKLDSARRTLAKKLAI